MIKQNTYENRKSATLLQKQPIFNNQNPFKTINSDILHFQDIQKKAQQSLLNLQYEYSPITRNPEEDFMTLTKNIKINSFKNMIFQNETINEQTKIPKNRFRKTKSSMISKKISQKDFKYFYRKETDAQVNLIDKKSFKNRFFDPKFTNSFLSTKSNLLTPRQSLPTIYPSENNYSVLERKPRSSMKPYSMQKGSHYKVSSVIKLRQQLNLFPSIQKQIRRRKIEGYN